MFPPSMILAALLVFADGTPQRRWYVPPQYQQAGWQVRCRAGTDGFAANCEAYLLAGSYLYRIVAADAQVIYLIQHEGCGTEREAFSRENIVSLSIRQRRAQAITAFDIGVGRLRTQCPSLPVSERDLSFIPDIAVAGEDVLR